VGYCHSRIVCPGITDRGDPATGAWRQLTTYRRAGRAVAAFGRPAQGGLPALSRGAGVRGGRIGLGIGGWVVRWFQDIAEILRFAQDDLVWGWGVDRGRARGPASTEVLPARVGVDRMTWFWGWGGWCAAARHAPSWLSARMPGHAGGTAQLWTCSGGQREAQVRRPVV
jgi:hypothetical protein